MLSRFTDKQKRQILEEVSSACKVPSVCQKYGISSSTLYRWKAKYASPALDPEAHLRSLEQENRRLKHRVAELHLDYNILRSALVNDRGSEC